MAARRPKFSFLAAQKGTRTGVRNIPGIEFTTKKLPSLYGSGVSGKIN